MSWPHAERNYHKLVHHRASYEVRVPLWYCCPSHEERLYSSSRYDAQLVNDCPQCGANLNTTRCDCIDN